MFGRRQHRIPHGTRLSRRPRAWRVIKDSVGTWEAPLKSAGCRNATARVEFSSRASCFSGESDQPIVVMKRGNTCGAKGLTKFEPCHGHAPCTLRWEKSAQLQATICNWNCFIVAGQGYVSKVDGSKFRGAPCGKFACGDL